MDSINHLVRIIVSMLAHAFRWNPEKEVVTLQTDFVLRPRSKASPKDNLVRFAHAGSVDSLLGKSKWHGLGYVFFLTPFEGTDDMRIRIEPLASNPDHRYFIRVTHASQCPASRVDLKRIFESSRVQTQQVLDNLAVSH